MNPIVVFLNGSPKQVAPDTTLELLVAGLKLSPRMVLIEHNGRALHRREWTGVRLEHGDRLEVLRVVAGG